MPSGRPPRGSLRGGPLLQGSRAQSLCRRRRGDRPGARPRRRGGRPGAGGGSGCAGGREAV